MLHASTQKLIIKLCELTAAGHIAWKHGEGQTRRFETEGYIVEVEGQPPTLRLLHSDGRELERADEPELAGQSWPDGDGTFATHISLLAAQADRIARGAELAISRILSSLSAPPKAERGDFLFRAPVAAEPSEPAPPPAPHTMPGPPPDPVASDTAIERVLAVESDSPRTIEPQAPEPEQEPVIMESETAGVVGDPEAEEDAAAEAADEIAESPAVATEAAEPEPVLIEAEAVAIVAAPVVDTPPASAPIPEPVPAPAYSQPQDAFGATQSFARPGNLTATPRAIAPKTFSTSPLFFGVNQLSREPVRTEPAPPPVPAPAPKPVPPAPPVAEKKREPAIAGPDIYKPWS